jgi:FMN reductase
LRQRPHPENRAGWTRGHPIQQKEIDVLVTAVAGNPKPGSRTLEAAVHLAGLLAPDAPDVTVETVDVVTLGPGLMGWGDAGVAAAVEQVRASDLVVVASPTFKATYTGILKLFLDQFDTGTGLAGVTVVPLMLGAGPAHFMAPDLLLKPVLVELGATCPAPGLYLLDKAYTGEAVDAYAERWAPVLHATAHATLTSGASA